MKEVENISSKPKPTIFPFAVMVGMFAFAIAEGNPGGLSGVSAFIIGIVAVIVLFLAIGLTLTYLEQNPKISLPVNPIFSPQGNGFIARLLKWQRQKAIKKRNIAALKRSNNLRNLLERRSDKYQYLIERLQQKEQLLQANIISTDDFEKDINEAIEAFRETIKLGIENNSTRIKP